MEETNLVPLEVIPPGSVMSIEINTDLYIRLQQLLLEGLPHKDLEDFRSTLRLVKEDKAAEGIPYHAHTLLFLLNLVELAAKKQGVIQKKEFDLQEKKVVD